MTGAKVRAVRKEIEPYKYRKRDGTLVRVKRHVRTYYITTKKKVGKAKEKVKRHKKRVAAGAIVVVSAGISVTAARRRHITLQDAVKSMRRFLEVLSRRKKGSIKGTDAYQREVQRRLEMKKKIARLANVLSKRGAEVTHGYHKRKNKGYITLSFKTPQEAVEYYKEIQPIFARSKNIKVSQYGSKIFIEIFGSKRRR